MVYQPLEPPRRSLSESQDDSRIRKPRKKSSTKKSRTTKSSRAGGRYDEHNHSPLENRPTKLNTSSLQKSDVFITGGIDIPFFLIVVVLLVVGLIMLLSATYPYAFQNKKSHYDSFYFFKRQIVFAIVGVAVMIFVSKLNYKLIKVVYIPLVAGTYISLALVLALSPNEEGFKRWISLGSFTFQPSDVAKFTLILMLAMYITKNYNKMKQIKYGVVIPAIIILSFCGLIAVEPHLSCTILIFVIGVSLMFAGGTRWQYFAVGAGFVVAVVMLVITNPDVLMNYASDRVTAWLDKSFDPLGARWQTNNSLYAIGSGGFWGVGLGNSKQKFLYVSEPQNDFIFAIVCEELGFFRSGCILGLFLALFVRGIHIAQKCEDKFGSLLVIGIVTQVAAQTGLNILVVTDTIPNTGIALPFFSYGGTAMMMLLFEMGVVLSISRKSNQKV